MMYATPCGDNAWVAVQVRTMHEKAAAEHLALQGYECFLPLQLQRAEANLAMPHAMQTNNARPLFPGYLFCRYMNHYRYRIVQAPGVVRILGFRGAPYAIPDEEIDAIVRIVNSGCNSEPWHFLQLGHRVKVNSGPLRGLEGILVSIKDTVRVVISVTLLRRSVAVEVDKLSIGTA
jgi:transcription antitermination factor NusG